MGLSCVSGVSHPGTATEAGLVKPRWLDSNWGNFYAILLSVLPAHHPCPLLFYLYYQFLFFFCFILSAPSQKCQILDSSTYRCRCRWHTNISKQDCEETIEILSKMFHTRMLIWSPQSTVKHVFDGHQIKFNSYA